MGMMNASRVSSMKPAVVLASGSVLFFKSNVGLKNKIKKALTKIIVTTILIILFNVYGYYLFFGLLLHIFKLGSSLALLTAFLEFSGDDRVGFLDKFFHWCIGLLLLEALENLGGVRHRSLIWLGVKLGVFVTRGILNLRIHHRLLTLLEHASSLSLVLLVTSHNLFKLLVRVVYILNLRGIGGNEKPLVHVYDVDIKGGILLLQTLGVTGSFITCRERTTDLDTKFIILLGRLGSNDGEAREDLSGYGGVVGFERHYTLLRHQNFKFLSKHLKNVNIM